jgi:hypothetical protein
MNIEIIRSVAYDNYDNFRHHIYMKLHFTIFKNYLMTKLTFRVRYFIWA